MNNLSISIVLYNNEMKQVKSVIKACLNDVNEKDIFIIDNSDEIQNYYKTLKSTKINYFKSKNHGFGSGHNKAINHFKLISKYKYHLILNPDINFKKNTLKKLVKYMDTEKNIGALMPRILNFDGSLQYSRRCLPKLSHLFMKRLFPYSKSALEYEIKEFEPNEPLQLIGISGCFMLTNLKIIKKIGGFDEKFFMYFEDLDLARRISLHSKVIYYPKLSIKHEGQSEHKRNLKLFYHLLYSCLIYFKKWGIKDDYRDKTNFEMLNRIKNMN